MKNSQARRYARIALGLMLLTTGLGHLTFARTAFQAQVPDWVPVSKDLTVVLSGYIELAFALALFFFWRYQRTVGLILAVFFVAVFPGNLAQYLNHRDMFGLDTDGLRMMRLFFQPVLILWALWCCRVWPKPQQPVNAG